jgi:hypothetical protein
LRARNRDCAACALKPQCTKAPSRVLSVNAHEEVRQHVASLAKTEAFKESARARRKVEMCFAHLKRNLNFRRLRLRGMTGARDECTLAAEFGVRRSKEKSRMHLSSPHESTATWRTMSILCCSKHWREKPSERCKR